MAFSKERVKEQEAMFKKATGVENLDGDIQELEVKLKSHAFWVHNRDVKGLTGHVALGHVVEGMIQDDKYDIIYLGLNGSEEMKAKLTELSQLQEDQIFQGHVRGFQKQGYGLEDAISKAREYSGFGQPGVAAEQPAEPAPAAEGKKGGKKAEQPAEPAQ